MNQPVLPLEQLEIFRGLTDSETSLIQQTVTWRRYRKGMFVFLEGEPATGLHFLATGKIKLSKALPDGREKILHFVDSGEIFAEVVLFDDGNYPATATTMEDCQVGILRNADLERIVIQNGQLALKILKVMSKRLRQAQIQNRDLAFQDTYGRLALALASLAEEYGLSKEDGIWLDLPVNQQEIASLIGASRETVARALAEFRKDGLIKTDKRRLCIVDLQGLRNRV